MASRRDDERTTGYMSRTARIVWTVLFAALCGGVGALAHWAVGLLCAALGALFVWERSAEKNLEARRDMKAAQD